MRPNSASVEALLITALLVVATEAALADDAISSEELNDFSRVDEPALAVRESAKSLRAQGALMNMDGPESNGVPFLDRFHLSEKFRVEYRQQFQMGEQDVSLKLYGPLVKERPGLALKLTGIWLGGLPVEVMGYGNIKKQAITFEIKF
jgi:hypothetical protein